MVEIPGSNGLLAEYMSSLQPLVSVICISFNHEPYVTSTLESVLKQTYPAVELIVIDNNSTDGSSDRIQALVSQYPAIQFIRNAKNVGVCRAFNQGLKLAKGRFVIDLAADDVLHPERIARQVAAFERLPGDYAVVFSNAALIDERSRLVGYHFPIDQNRKTIQEVPSGWVFKEVLASYFICTPTMMMRREVLESLGGYDESLCYEDFDLWVRTARNYRYYYQDEILTSKRILPRSFSRQFSEPNNALLRSTLAVCYKAFDQCQTAEEYKALAGRIRWFIRRCFYTQQYELAFQYKELLEYMEEADWLTSAVLQFCKWHIPVNWFYKKYARLRENREVTVAG